MFRALLTRSLVRQPVRAFSKYHPRASDVQVGQLLEAKGKGAIHGRVASVDLGDTVLRAVQLMNSEKTGSVLVTSENYVAGILTERDYVRKVACLGKDSQNTLVSEIMTPNPYCVTPDETLDHCMELMLTNRNRHLPVAAWLNPGDPKQKIFQKDIVGMLSVRDVILMIHSLGNSPKWQKLSQLSVNQVLKKVHSQDRVYTIQEDDTVLKALKAMSDFKVGSLVVRDKNQMTGIITERDYLTKIRIKNRNSRDTKVGDICTHVPVCITANYTLDQVMELFKTHSFRHLPVVSSESVDSQADCINLISITDIVRATAAFEDIIEDKSEEKSDSD